MPSVQGILETALYVRDIRQAADFYRRVFGFDTLLEVDRLTALDVAGRNVLLLFQAGATRESVSMPGGVIPGHGGGSDSPGHFAFSIRSEDFAPWQQRLESLGIAVESIVTWPSGTKSIYFRDPDQNLVELITPGFWRIY